MGHSGCENVGVTLENGDMTQPDTKIRVCIIIANNMEVKSKHYHWAVTVRIKRADHILRRGHTVGSYDTSGGR